LQLLSKKKTKLETFITAFAVIEKKKAQLEQEIEKIKVQLEKLK
jgi:predicted house-cleaning NTP pyrophosphatase (Maf/HAM1 superfamily)